MRAIGIFLEDIFGIPYEVSGMLIGFIVLILGFLFAMAYFIRTNSISVEEYDTTSPFISNTFTFSILL